MGLLSLLPTSEGAIIRVIFASHHGRRPSALPQIADVGRLCSQGPQLAKAVLNAATVAQLPPAFFCALQSDCVVICEAKFHVDLEFRVSRKD